MTIWNNPPCSMSQGVISPQPESVWPYGQSSRRLRSGVGLRAQKLRLPFASLGKCH